MKAFMTVNFLGLETQLNAALERVQRGTKKATLAACEELLKISQAQCPVRSGTLVGSGYIEIQGSYKDFTGEVGYARSGPAMEYCIIVHEDMSATHTHGKAKFLEDPVRAYAENYSARAAMFINGELQGK